MIFPTKTNLASTVTNPPPPTRTFHTQQLLFCTISPRRFGSRISLPNDVAIAAVVFHSFLEVLPCRWLKNAGSLIRIWNPWGQWCPRRCWKKPNVSTNQGSDDLSFGLEIHASKETLLRLKGTITINIYHVQKNMLMYIMHSLRINIYIHIYIYVRVYIKNGYFYIFDFSSYTLWLWR